MLIETCVNVPDSVIFGNISHNSKLPINWVKDIPQHDGHAVIVGGGPSVLDWLDEIKFRQAQGQKVFALNGAAKLLHEHGVITDYSVILDARESNIEFIGYAKHYLIASQCHPSVARKAYIEHFAEKPAGFHIPYWVTLWHQHYPDNMEEFDAAIPEFMDDYALIGGGTTVGLSALCLAYTMGFRQLHLYGYDSSYKDGETHAYKQHDVQSVACEVTVAGRKFQTSLAMAQQAELFPQISDLLIDAGCTITIRGDGLLPYTSKMSALPADKPEFADEASKYTHMWDIPEYSHYSPGEHLVDTFIEVVNPNKDRLIVDLGCGTGRAGLELSKRGYSVLLMDFTENSRDDATKNLPFLKADLSYPLPIVGQYGFCTDVLEHIPTRQVEAVIQHILHACGKVFFQICLVEDHFGQVIGQHLHLTVQSYVWWKECFESLGHVIEWSRDDKDTALFYVTYRSLGKGN